MKKLNLIFLLIVMTLFFTACSDEQAITRDSNNVETNVEAKNNTSNADSETVATDKKILVAYFSMPETDYPTNMTQEEDNSAVVIDGEVLGNTQYIANLIVEYTAGDIFRIERAEPYPTNHDTLVDLAAEEQADNVRPELLNYVENIEQYDMIFLGYPNWWADMPMPLYTFLEEHDLSEKIVVPFNTHGGSGFSNTINTIKELQPNATVIEKGFTVSRNNAEESKSDVINWLENLEVIN